RGLKILVSVVRFRPRPPKLFNEISHLALTGSSGFFLPGYDVTADVRRFSESSVTRQPSASPGQSAQSMT
ncbi:MAG: hypothetical protein WCH44_16790, partial [Betaproteobacteria bacterium]